MDCVEELLPPRAEDALALRDPEGSSLRVCALERAGREEEVLEVLLPSPDRMESEEAGREVEGFDDCEG